ARRRLGTVLAPVLRRAQPRLDRWMEAPRADDLLERVHRHAIPLRGKIALDVVLEAAAGPRALRALDAREIDARRIHDRRAGALELVDRRHEHVDYFRVGRVALVRLPQDADPRACQRVALERLAIVRNRAAVARRGRRIVRIL